MPPTEEISLLAGSSDDSYRAYDFFEVH